MRKLGSTKGRRSGAIKELEAAKRYWQSADADLPELKEIEQALSAAANRATLRSP